MFFSKHPLKKPDHVIAVLQDQPVLRGIPGEDLETELFVETARSLDILDSQADRKRAKFHTLLLLVRKRLPPNDQAPKGTVFGACILFNDVRSRLGATVHNLPNSGRRG